MPNMENEPQTNLDEMIKWTEDEDVTITRNHKPVAVLISYARYQDLIDQIEEARDELSIAERKGDTVPLDEAARELDL